MTNKPASKNDIDNLKKGLIAGSAILTALLGYAAYHSLALYQRESVQLRSLKEQRQNLEQDSIGLGKLIEQYTREQEKFQEMLFKEQDIPLFLEELAVFAKEARVKILDVKTRSFVMVNYSKPTAAQQNQPSGAKPEEQGLVLSSLPVQVSIQGTFESIVNFLMKLERYRQLLTLSDVDIKINEYPQLHCSLVVSIYSLRDMNKGIGK